MRHKLYIYVIYVSVFPSAINPDSVNLSVSVSEAWLGRLHECTSSHVE